MKITNKIALLMTLSTMACFAGEVEGDGCSVTGLTKTVKRLSRKELCEIARKKGVQSRKSVQDLSALEKAMSQEQSVITKPGDATIKIDAFLSNLVNEFNSLVNWASTLREPNEQPKAVYAIIKSNLETYGMNYIQEKDFIPSFRDKFALDSIFTQSTRGKSKTETALLLYYFIAQTEIDLAHIGFAREITTESNAAETAASPAS